MADADEALREVAALVAAVLAYGPSRLEADLAPVAKRLSLGVGASPQEAEARLRQVLGLDEDGALDGDCPADVLRVRIHAHLKLHPGLTARETASALGAGEQAVRRLLYAMEYDGEAEPDDDEDPATTWRAT